MIINPSPWLQDRDVKVGETVSFPRERERRTTSHITDGDLNHCLDVLGVSLRINAMRRPVTLRLCLGIINSVIGGDNNTTITR